MLIIYAHGAPGSIGVNKEGDSGIDWFLYKDFFKQLKKEDGGSPTKPIAVFLFACYASSACTKEIVELLPEGSFIGFFAPKNDISRMGVLQRIINETLICYLKGEKSNIEILFEMMPCCQSFIAYNRPEGGGFRAIEFPSYIEIRKANDVPLRIAQNFDRYISFLKENGCFNEATPMHINPADKYKNRNDAVVYLKTVAPDLRSHHTMSFPESNIGVVNLKRYFEAWNDQAVVGALQLAGPLGVQHFSTIIPFLAAPKYSSQTKISAEKQEAGASSSLRPPSPI